MPAQYEAIRDKLIKQGVGVQAAKTSAAKIYNSIPANKKHPVTNKPDSKPKVGVRRTK